MFEAGVFFVFFFFRGVLAVDFEGRVVTGLFGAVISFGEIGEHPAVAMAFTSSAATTLSFAKRLDSSSALILLVELDWSSAARSNCSFSLSRWTSLYRFRKLAFSIPPEFDGVIGSVCDSDVGGASGSVRDLLQVLFSSAVGLNSTERPASTI